MSTFNKQPGIIGIAGTFASGKDKYAEHLSETYGYRWEQTSALVRQQAMRQHGSVERPVLYRVADELRHSRGAATFVEQALRQKPPLVITGIRALGEAKAVKAAGGVLVFIDAPPKVRYHRMLRRARDQEVQLSLQEFILNEEKEMYSGSGDADFNLRGIKAMAEIVSDEDLGLEAFYRTLDAHLGLN